MPVQSRRSDTTGRRPSSLLPRVARGSARTARSSRRRMRRMSRRCSRHMARRTCASGSPRARALGHSGSRSTGSSPMLRNRVYLGEARSVGKKQNFIKPKAHPPLITEGCFNRIQARLGAQAVEYHSRGRRAPNTIRPLTKVLRCALSGLVMSYDSQGYWRCKGGSRGECGCGAQSLKDTKALQWVIDHAQRWHAENALLWALGRAADDATRPALE